MKRVVRAPCGVFTLAFADLLSLGEKINFTQDDIYVMRGRIALALLERTGLESVERDV